MFTSHQWIEINVSHIDESIWKQDLCIINFRNAKRDKHFLQLGTSLHIIRQKYLLDTLKISYHHWSNKLDWNEPLYEKTSQPFAMTRNIYFKNLFEIENNIFFQKSGLRSKTMKNFSLSKFDINTIVFFRKLIYGEKVAFMYDLSVRQQVFLIFYFSFFRDQQVSLKELSKQIWFFTPYW